MKTLRQLLAEIAKITQYADSKTIHSRKIKYDPDDVQGKHSYSMHGIDEYVGNNAWSINRYLHRNLKGVVKKPPEEKTWVKEIDSVFANKNNHVGKHHIVYTGIPESPDKLFDKESEKRGAAKNKIHHVVAHFPAYISATTEEHVAKRFADSYDRKESDPNIHVLKLHVPPHHPSMSIKKISTDPSQNEVLLHRGTRVKIHPNPIQKRGKDGTVTNVWHGEVVGHHLDDLQ